MLAANGFAVTQATVSRDLDAVGAVKETDGSGSRYTLASPGDGERARLLTELRHTLDQFVESVAVSGTLVVVRVPPGAAHLVAGKIDGSGVDGILGTVAGDDTLLVVAAESTGAEAVARALEGSAPWE